MNHFKKALWRLGQPFTKRPVDPLSVVSDLFIWRKSNEFQTYFELLCLPYFFQQDVISEKVKIIIFDKSGKQIYEGSIEVFKQNRKTLNISSFIDSGSCEYGTFAVFHEFNPQVFLESNSFLSERGYSSYQYMDGGIRSYVHGNFDAISLSSDGQKFLLGGRSFLKRSFYLQYVFEPNFMYELIFVNPTIKTEKFEIIGFGPPDLPGYECVFTIAAGGSYKFDLPMRDYPLKILIRSNLIMARPVIFKSNLKYFDVFHG